MRSSSSLIFFSLTMMLPAPKWLSVRHDLRLFELSIHRGSLTNPGPISIHVDSASTRKIAGIPRGLDHDEARQVSISLYIYRSCEVFSSRKLYINIISPNSRKYVINIYTYIRHCAYSDRKPNLPLVQRPVSRWPRLTLRARL